MLVRVLVTRITQEAWNKLNLFWFTYKPELNMQEPNNTL